MHKQSLQRRTKLAKLSDQIREQTEAARHAANVANTARPEPPIAHAPPAAPSTNGVAVEAAKAAKAAVKLGSHNTSGKPSGKSKESRGIPEHWVSSWVDFNLEPEKNKILASAARQRQKSISDLLRGMLEHAVEEAWPTLETLAATWDADPTHGTKSALPTKPFDEMTPEEQEAALKKSQTVLDRAMAQADKAKEMIAKAKAAQAARLAAATNG
jgi:hypothetical protein